MKVAVRKGAVGDLLVYVAARYHHEVEPLRAPDGVLDCWGYAFREIRGNNTDLSNHSSGSAVDLRARKHPMGTAVSATFTPAQIAACTRIMNDCAPVIRWGGTYSGRVDSMHWEGVSARESDYATVLARIQQTGDDMFNDDDRAKLTGVFHQLSGSPRTGEWPGWPSWVNPNEHLTLLDYLRRNEQDMAALRLELSEDRQDMLNAIGSLQSELAALKARLP